MLGSRAAQPALQSIRAWAAGENGVSALRDLGEGLARRRTSPPPTTAPFEADISFEGVTCHVFRSGRAVLRSETFEIAHGARVDLWCPTGAAAMALADILLGEAVPDRGRATLAGHDPVRWAAARGPGGVVVVDDAPLTLEGSILDNIAASDDPAGHEAAYEAAECVGLDGFIYGLPVVWDTDLRGSGLHLGSSSRSRWPAPWHRGRCS